MNDVLAVPHLLVLVAGACLLAFLALWWFALGSRRLARRRHLRRRIEALRPLAPPSREQDEALVQVRRAVAQACASLADKSGPRGHVEALYDTPWFLCIANAAADTGGLLAGATESAGIAAARSARPAQDSSWQVWTMPALLVLQTDAAVVDAAPAPRASVLWYTALLELAERRDRLPLNGVIVGVGASALLGSAGAIASDAARLHDRLIETCELLRLHLPVYLVITGLEKLEGYGAFHAALPAAALGQALGHRMAQGAMGNGHRRPKVEWVFGAIVQRLHALRMGLLRRAPDPARRLAIHQFVEQVRALEPGLEILVNGLFDRPGGMPPRWRGLYFTAAPTAERPGAFIGDVFGRFLPADQPLARN